MAIWNSHCLEINIYFRGSKISLMRTLPPQFQSHLIVDIRLMKNHSHYEISTTKHYKCLRYWTRLH